MDVFFFARACPTWIGTVTTSREWRQFCKLFVRLCKDYHKEDKKDNYSFSTFQELLKHEEWGKRISHPNCSNQQLGLSAQYLLLFKFKQ